MPIVAPDLDPETVVVTSHARERYGARRNTRPEAVNAGIARLLVQAARKPTPPLRWGVDGHPPHRSMVVGGFRLVFSADMRTLITLWRCR